MPSAAYFRNLVFEQTTITQTSSKLEMGECRSIKREIERVLVGVLQACTGVLAQRVWDLGVPKIKVKGSGAV